MLSMLLGKFRIWGLAIGGALLMGLYVALKIARGQLEDAKYEIRKYKYQAKQRKAVDENLAEVDQAFSHRAAVRQQEKQDEPEKVPDRLRDNDNF